MGIEWLTGAASTLISGDPLEFTTFEFGAGSLRVGCLWRLIAGGNLRLTSGDHGHQYGLPAPIDALAVAETLLLGRRVAGSRFREATSDLVLEFEGDIQLEVIADSSGYEPWSFTAPGVHLIALGGGGLA